MLLAIIHNVIIEYELAVELLTIQKLTTPSRGLTAFFQIVTGPIID